MNKVLILLLVTLVQSQSDGVVLSTPNSDDHLQDSQLEDWNTTDGSYSEDIIKDYDPNSQSYRKRLITSDAFTRRSALDKNFMRFGRGGDVLQKRCGRKQSSNGKLNFRRFGRGLKDNFIRFGKAGGGGKDGFIRFGRALPDDFFRAAKSLRENFIRFGKTDENFMRFGRGNTDENYQDFFLSEEPFQSLEKYSRSQDGCFRVRKSGENGRNFLRFGKRDAESESPNENNQDMNVSEEVKRKRRNSQEKSPAKNGKTKNKRSTEFFEMPSADFLKRISSVLDGSWRSSDNFKNSRLTPFFPVYPSFPKSFNFYRSETKRNQGGSNFIRFG